MAKIVVMPSQRSALGWVLSLFVGSLVGGWLSMTAVSIFAPTILYVDTEACTPAEAPVRDAINDTSAEGMGQQTLVLQEAVANARLQSPNVTAEDFVPGQKGDWSALEQLLKRNEELRDELAAGRRAFLWSTKMKMAELKGKLKAVKAVQDKAALQFLLDDRNNDAVPEGLAEIEKLEWEEAVGKFQEVDQPALPEPMSVSVERAKDVIDRRHKAKEWDVVHACVNNLRMVDDLAAQIARLAQAKLDAASESALASVAKIRIKELWHGAAEWMASWKQPFDQFASYTGDGDERKQRSEIAYWALKFNLMWPMEGPDWFPLAGRHEASLAGEATESRDEIINKLVRLEEGFNSTAQEFSQKQSSLEELLEEARNAAKGSCEVSEEQLKTVFLSAGALSRGFCSSKEAEGSPDAGSWRVPVAPAYLWKRDWVPNPEAEAEAGVPTRVRDLKPPVTVSILVVLEWGNNLADIFSKLWSCTGGLRGEQEVGSGQHIAGEVLVALDSNVAAAHRLALLQVLADQYKPFFVTRVAFFSHGATGANKAKMYNTLAAMASGDLLLMHEPFSEWPNDCHFLYKLLRPFQAWPRLAAIGGQEGQMSLFNTPGTDYLVYPRNAFEPTHNRLRDPIIKDRMQFLLGVREPALVFRKSAFLTVGGFDEAAAGQSSRLMEFDLCRRLWIAGFQVGMSYLGQNERLGLGQRATAEKNFFQDSPLGSLETRTVTQEVEARIVAEVKRENRFLKPTPIWE